MLNFLAYLNDNNMSYSAINVIKSALSSVLGFFDGKPLGQHELVIRLMKGVARRRPPQPKYSQFWDVDEVLQALSRFPSDFASLTYKTCFLLALCVAARVSELSGFTTDCIFFTSTGVKLILPKLAKVPKVSTRDRRLFEITPFSDLALCPVNALKQYLEVTSAKRGDCKSLFVSVNAPHRAVSSATVARWLKLVLERCGVDISIYSAHSVRGAAVSKAQVSLPAETLMKCGRWSCEGTFTRYYLRVDNARSLTQHVLP